MKKLSFLILAMAVTIVSAQNYKESGSAVPATDISPNYTVLLYPQGQKGGTGIQENGIQITQAPQEDNGLRGEEVVTASGSRSNIGDDARMDFYFPKKPSGLMVIVLPGGGYAYVSSFNEGVYGAKWLVEHGIAACVLKYRMPNEHSTVPLDDVQNAMRYCRYHAADWGVKQVGVMGGSAGGHLASSCATMWTDAITRPDFAVLLYPRITLRRGEKCGTKDRLLGVDEKWNDRIEEHQKMLRKYSPENYISSQTPPIYMALSANDLSVPATNMLPFYTKLIENGVSTELHVFPVGGHGWGFNKQEYLPKGKRDKLEEYREQFESTLANWLKRVARMKSN